MRRCLFLMLLVLLTACEAPVATRKAGPEKAITPVSGSEGRPIVPDKIDIMKGRPLLSELKKGGYILYFRHFQSDHSMWHEDPIKPKHAEMTVKQIIASCDQQRPLSEYGRKLPKDVGVAMRKLGVPIGSVLSSPYCRVIESARLVADRAPDATLYDLMHRGGGHTAAMQNRNLRPYLAQTPAAGTNTIIMAHRPQMDAIKFIEEGECFIFRPEGEGRFKLVATVYDSEWLEALLSVDYLGAKATLPGGDAPPRSANALLPTPGSNPATSSAKGP